MPIPRTIVPRSVPPSSTGQPYSKGPVSVPWDAGNAQGAAQAVQDAAWGIADSFQGFFGTAEQVAKSHEEL